jgi:dynein heavy chain, axonemal
MLLKIRRTLGDLQKAIKGLVLMSKDLDAMFTSLQNNKVPALWESVAYPSLKPLSSWFTDMTYRVRFFQDWISPPPKINPETGEEEQRSGRPIPISFWISAFYFPQGFLTAVLQGYSRAHLIPVDILSFEFVVQDFEDATLELEDPPEEGCLVHGMFMDGCRWSYDRMLLEDQDPGVMYVPAPVIHFLPTTTGANAAWKNNDKPVRTPSHFIILHRLLTHARYIKLHRARACYQQPVIVQISFFRFSLILIDQSFIGCSEVQRC